MERVIPGRVPSRLRWYLCRRIGLLLIVILLVNILHSVAQFLIAYNTPVYIDCKRKDQYGGIHFQKNLHQIWTTEDVPEKWARLQQKCIAMNPEYEYMLWTQTKINEFMSENYPWFMPTFLSYSYQMQRLDAARYFILYHYGGVYVDMDMECLTSFDDIFTNVSKINPTADIVLGAMPLGVTSSFLMAKRHHSFMEYITTRLINFNHWYFLPYFTVMFGTGPYYLSLSTYSFSCKDDIYTIPYQTHALSYLDHKHASSWHHWDGSILILFYSKRNLIVLGVCLLVYIIVLIIRKYWKSNALTLKFARSQNV